MNRAYLLLALLLPAPALAQPAPTARTLFAEADANHDGRITWPEAEGFLQRAFARVDADHDGALSEPEWQAASFNARRTPPKPSPRRAALFRALDTDRDGKLTQAELRPAAEAWFRALDANGDQALTAEELPKPRRAKP